MGCFSKFVTFRRLHFFLVGEDLGICIKPGGGGEGGIGVVQTLTLQYVLHTPLGCNPIEINKIILLFGWNP